MTNLLTLAAQIEQATEDQQAELIRMAATAILGSVPDRMNRALSAEAYESAAILLAPAGYTWTIYGDGCAGVCPRHDDDDIADGSEWAATPALALAAACCRAVVQEREPHNA
jgi:hypothetical protein